MQARVLDPYKHWIRHTVLPLPAAGVAEDKEFWKHTVRGNNAMQQMLAC